MIIDHEDLLHRVIDPSSRGHLREAVKAYGAAAFRAAVMSTWIAVVYDLIAKLRELAAAGDKEAEKHVALLDKAIESQNKDFLQKFERDLLRLFHEDIKFLGHREFLDLKRMQEDRHHCAHPAFVTPNEPYQPSAELARLHIVNAVQFVLSQEARHGKAMMDELKRLLLSLSFPSEQQKIAELIRTSILKRARPPLIGQMASALTKAILLDIDADLQDKRLEMSAIIAVLLDDYPEPTEESCKNALNRDLLRADDQAIWRLYWLIAQDQRFFEWLDRAIQIRLTTLTEHWTPKTGLPFGPGDYVSPIEPLKTAALAAFGTQRKVEDRVTLFGDCPLPEFRSALIDEYAASSDWHAAQDNGFAILPALAASETLTASDVRKVLAAATENSQIYGAWKSGTILRDFFVATKRLHKDVAEDWSRFLNGRKGFDQVKTAMLAEGLPLGE